HTRWPRDWSSDVCSSDLTPTRALDQHAVDAALFDEARVGVCGTLPLAVLREQKDEVPRPGPVEGAADDRRVDGVAQRGHEQSEEIGRASCRETVEIAGEG